MNNIDIGIQQDPKLLFMFRQLAPRTYKFLAKKFKYTNKTLVEQNVLAVLRIMLLTFLKNFPEYKNLSVQKFFLFYGQGGSGKSTIVNLIKKFIYSNHIFSGDLASLGGRFETGFMRDKTFLSFADEEMTTTFSGEKENKKTSMLKRLTGGDDIRYEVKFGGVSSFVNKGLVFITSNTKNIYAKNVDYASMKRRLQSFHIRKTIDSTKQDPNILEEIIQGEFIAIALLAIRVSANTNSIVAGIRN